MTEFRIEYTIQRMDEGDEDFVDIGFGSSGGWSTINAASYAVESDIQNRSWETEPHMPDPEDAEGDDVQSLESADPVRCPKCGGLDGAHGSVHTRYGNGGGGNRPCSRIQESGDPS